MDKKRNYWVCKIIAAHLKQVDAYTVEGYRIITGWARLRKIYFVAKFDQPIKDAMFASGRRTVTATDLINSNAAKIAVRFDTHHTQRVQMKVALSATSRQAAYKNLQAELPGWDFEATKKDAAAVWNKTLGVIEATGTLSQKQIFYTGLYRNCIQPK